MRLIKMFGFATLAALVVMAFVSVALASAQTTTGLCSEHVDLECPEGSETTSVHMTLQTGTVGRLLSSLVTVLCLFVLAEANPLSLGQPQSVHFTTLWFEWCGTNSTHSNCTVSILEEPLANLLKTGLDSGSLTATNGRFQLYCPSLGIACIYDTEGLLFSVGGQHLTANETTVKELGGKFFCPDNGKLDGLLETTFENTYILQ